MMRFATALLGVLTLAAACTAPSSPAAPSPSPAVVPSGRTVPSLNGPAQSVSVLLSREFVSMSINAKVPLGTDQVRIAFPKPLWIEASGCNSHHAKLADEPGKLAIAGPMDQTLMTCSETKGNLDFWLRAFLKRGPSWRVTGNDLVLVSDDESITFIDRKATP